MFEKLANLFTRRTPTVAKTRTIARNAAQAVNPGSLDVDFVHAILTASDGGDATQLMALYETIIYSDSHLQGELSKRKLAVLGDPWSAQPADPKNADDVAAAQIVGAQLGNLPSFFDACAALLGGCLYPVVLVEKLYRPTPGRIRYSLADLVPVPPALLHFDPAGPLRIYDVDCHGQIQPSHQMADPMRYIVHRGHLLGDRDHKGGPMRSLVFWWLFGSFDRDWWARFLDRYGSPFLLGKYDQDDDDSRMTLQTAFSLATRLGGIVVSRETDVEIKEAMSQSAGQAFELFHAICQKEKSKLIVGQTTSASAEAAGGLGSGVGTAQAAVRDDIRQFDRLRLADTLRHQVVDPFLRLNDLRGNVTIVFGAEAPEDSEKTSRALALLANAGVELTDQGITDFSERLGLGLQRKTAPVPPAGPMPGISALSAALLTDPRALLADAANQRVARGAAADLAEAFRGDLAPFQRLLRESTSAADFETRLRDQFPSWSPARTLPLLEAGLTAFAANGLP